MGYLSAYYFSHVITKLQYEAKYYNKMCKFQDQFLSLMDEEDLAMMLSGLDSQKMLLKFYEKHKDTPDVEISADDWTLKYLRQHLEMVNIPLTVRQFVVPILKFLEM